MKIENLDEQILTLQNEVQAIDIQLTTRNNEYRERVLSGEQMKDAEMEYRRWKAAACQAKVIKNNQLRKLKAQRKVMPKPEEGNSSYRKVGLWIAKDMPLGSFCKDENGWYFRYINEDVTDYFETSEMLVEHMMAVGE